MASRWHASGMLLRRWAFSAAIATTRVVSWHISSISAAEGGLWVLSVMTALLTLEDSLLNLWCSSNGTGGPHQRAGRPSRHRAPRGRALAGDFVAKRGPG